MTLFVNNFITMFCYLLANIWKISSPMKGRKYKSVVNKCKYDSQCDGDIRYYHTKKEYHHAGSYSIFFISYPGGNIKEPISLFNG